MICAALARGNVQLALSVYEAMCRAGPNSGVGSSGGVSHAGGPGFGGFAWPHASLDTVSAVVHNSILIALMHAYLVMHVQL